MDTPTFLSTIKEEVINDPSKLSLDNIINSIKSDQVELGINIKKHNLPYTPISSRILDSELKEKSINKESIDNEGTQIIYNWKLIESYPSRLIKIFDETVLLELIIDNEQGWFEEREFKKNLFKKINLEEVIFFKVKCFERPGEERLVVEEGTGMVKESDFPKIDFSKFSNENIFF